jgi:hypothetical protein
MLIASAFGVGPIFRPSTVLATAGPIAHWTFDEGSGTTAADSAGSHDGAFQGTPTWVTSGAAVGSGAISFAGAGNGVIVPDDPGLEPTSITIAAWVRSSGPLDDRRQIIVQKGANGCEAGSWAIKGVGQATGIGSVEGDADAAGTGIWQGVDSDTGRPWDNVWHHVAFTFDETANELAIYLDGVRRALPGSALLYGLPTTEALFIGAPPVACSARTEYAGQLDDLRIYDRALTPEEIASFLPPAVSTTTTLDLGPTPIECCTAVEVVSQISPVPSTLGAMRLYRVTGGAHEQVAASWIDQLDGRAYFMLAPQVGVNSYVAEYESTPRYSGSTSVAETLEVTRSARTTTLTASDSTLLPTEPVTLTARVDDYSDGLITFRDTQPDGLTVVLGSGYGSWDGVGYSTSVTVPSLSIGTHSIRARLAQTPTVAASNSNIVTVVVRRQATRISIGVTGVPQTNHPQEVAVSIAAPGLDSPPGPPTGTIIVRDGSTVIRTLAVADWMTTFEIDALALGTHSFRADYSGDAVYGANTSDRFTLVITPDVVQASSAGPEFATFYPPKDGYRDTVNIVGDRQESIWVGIKFYSPAGVQVGNGAVSRGTGPYSFTWSGRAASGLLLPAGQYKVVQRLKDGTGNEKVVTSFVTLSTKRLVDHTIYVTKPGSAISSHGATGTGSVTTSSGYAKVSAGSAGWAGAGWEFTLPSAVVYRSIAFQIQAKSPFVVPPASIGMQNFTSCPLGPGDWDASCFDATTGIGSAPGALTWYSTAGSVTDNRSDRTVRGMIGQPSGTSYVYTARVKVTYAILE